MISMRNSSTMDSERAQKSRGCITLQHHPGKAHTKIGGKDTKMLICSYSVNIDCHQQKLKH